MRHKVDEAFREHMISFLREYRRRECLWNTKCKDYPNKAIRTKALNELGHIFGLSVLKVKSKIRAIRATYARVRVKMAEWEYTGRPYIPLLFWYKEATFLPETVPRKNPRKNRRKTDREKSIILRKIDSEDVYDDEDDDSVDVGTDYIVKDGSVGDGEEEFEEDGITYLEYNEDPGEEEEDNPDVVIINTYEETETEEAEPQLYDAIPSKLVSKTVVEEQETVENLERPSSPAEPRKSKDEFYHFAEFLSCQLRSLPEPISIELMAQMHSQLSAARMKALGYKK